jgi:hypothetical protein
MTRYTLPDWDTLELKTILDTSRKAHGDEAIHTDTPLEHGWTPEERGGIPFIGH